MTPLPGTDLHVYLAERERERRLRWFWRGLLWGLVVMILLLIVVGIPH